MNEYQNECLRLTTSGLRVPHPFVPIPRDEGWDQTPPQFAPQGLRAIF
jgi:hypothetical protein